MSEFKLDDQDLREVKISALEQPPTLLFCDRKGESIDAEDLFKPINNPQHKAFLAPSGAGMSFNLSKEMTNE